MTPTDRSRWQTLTSAAHRSMFLAGMATLAGSSCWWGLHLLARQYGWPLFTLNLRIAPIWAHTFPMLFTVFPAFFFGFLFTVFPRWMGGPLVARRAYVATGLLLVAATLTWLIGIHFALTIATAGGLLAIAGLCIGAIALTRTLLDAQQGVPHAYAVLAGLFVEIVAACGFTFGIATGSEVALHFAVRTALWGGLLPVFFAVCHRMIPFFSQNVVPGYVAWRPQWVLVTVVALVYIRLLLGTAGALRPLVGIDAALFALTALCAIRWTSLRARGNPLAWTLYAAFAWLPVALLLQTVRDLGFVLTGEWLLGRAPIHALGMGFFGGMLIAMATRVTMGHSGRSLKMDNTALACFIAIAAAAVARVSSEIVTAPAWIQCLLLASIALWLAAFGTWSARLGRIYLAPRIDGQPG